MRIVVLLVWLLAFASPALLCEQLFVTTHRAMGTEFKLYLYAKDSAQAQQVSQAVYEEVDRLDDLLSNYKPESELSRINRLAASGPVETDPETFDFLQQAQHWSEVSHGAFDMTVGPLMRVWGFFQHQGKVPSVEELQAAAPAIGYRHVVLDAQRRTVFFDTKGVELDPGGIGKGFAVDAAVQVLREWQVKAAMLSAGGSTVYALGAPPQKSGWKVIVRGPVPSQNVISVLTLRDTSFSSADCSQKNFVQNGVLYCHILNPVKLAPVKERIQVAMEHRSATASDALSNVLFVQEPKEAFDVLRREAADARALVISKRKDGTAAASIYRWNAPIHGINVQYH